MEKKVDILGKEQGFVMALIGKPGSGKTYIIKDLLKTKLKDQYSYVVLCSPSSMEYKGIIPETQTTNTFSIEWLYKIINMINVSQQGAENKKVLLIIDDCIADLKEKQKDHRLTSLFFNRRHLIWGGMLNILFTAQKYTMIPARYRSCITNLILFSISPFDMQKIFEESIIKYTKAQWQMQIEKIYEKEHNYLEIDVDKQIIN